MIIAVDFDGTCVEHMFPKVGPDVPHAQSVLRQLQKNGHAIILWTMRDHASSEDPDGPSTIADAINWFEQRGIALASINRSAPHADFSESNKAYAQIYIDDAALGCPLIPGVFGDRPMVDWKRVERLLVGKGAL